MDNFPSEAKESVDALQGYLLCGVHLNKIISHVVH
jgi:hypothetical protein